MVDKKKQSKGAGGGAGEAFRRANRTKGGFLDDVDVEVTGAVIKRDSFTGNDGSDVEKTVIALTLDIEGRDAEIEKSWSCGNNCRPSEDGEEPSEEGAFFSKTFETDDGQTKNFKGLNDKCAASQMLDSLLDLGAYSEDDLVENGIGILVGIKGHLNEVDSKMKSTKFKANPVPIFTSVVGKGGKATKASPAPAKKVAKKTEDEVEEAEEMDDIAADDTDNDDLSTEVTALVAKIAKKGPVAKSKVAQAIGKAYEGKDNRMEAVKLGMSDKFLKEGAAGGEWSYEKGMVGPA